MIFKKPFNYFKYNYFIISFHLENIFIKIIEPNKPAKNHYVNKNIDAE